MGAWDSGNWHNDDALDWIPELQARGVDAIRTALAEAHGKGRLGAGRCCRALAAAEVVAAVFSRPGLGLPDEVETWASANGTHVMSDRVASAIGAVRHVEGESELQQLFDEAGRNESWHGATADLRDRLAAI